MSTRGEATRQKILDAAEAVFGDRGVANVSLAQVQDAAGQRNERAVQYHFGDRAGLIRALQERHSPGVEAIQERIEAALPRRSSMRDLVEVWARPIIEYGTLGPGERAWVKILDSLLSDSQLSVATILHSQPPQRTSPGVAVFERLQRTMAKEIAAERVWAGAQFVVHIAADRARLVDDAHAARSLRSDDEFIDNLLKMVHGAMVARP